MISRLLVPALLAVLLAGLHGPALAKGAPDYYHGSAHKFVAGRHQEALVQAEEGLSRFPNDEALKGLVAHLRKLKDQQKKDQGSQGSSQGDEGKQQEDKQDGQQGGDKDQENKEKDKPEDEQDEKGKEGEDKGQGQESEGKDGQDSTGEAMAPVKPGEMSKEDAERLLNSIQDDEKKEHKQQQRRFRKKAEVEQDW